MSELTTLKTTSGPICEDSFYDFISQNYHLSKFILPAQKPEDDSLDDELKARLLDLIDERDYYEINILIKRRYLLSIE